jgi:hypothetical protein
VRSASVSGSISGLRAATRRISSSPLAGDEEGGPSYRIVLPLPVLGVGTRRSQRAYGRF